MRSNLVMPQHLMLRSAHRTRLEAWAMSKLRCLAADVLQQGYQRRRRDARNPGRLAQGGWFMGLQLLPDFIGKAADRAVVEIRWQQESLIAAVRGDILPLAGQITVVAAIDGQLLDDIRPDGAEFWPKTDETVP